jgi:alpha-glucosidase
VPEGIQPDCDWWRTAVVYEIYIRSFADGNGDGTGDIAGIRSRLPYLASLGVDAIWITPWYPSPMADGGYDISDYQDIAPEYGDLAEARELIADAHRHSIRVIIDLVPNHTSDRHPWFRRAVAAGPGSRQRSRYWFRPGRGAAGGLPPNDWQSVFGGSAWTRLPASGTAGDPEWYLHLFAPEQPDLNWGDPGVADEFDAIIRFWFDLGIDGLRIDVAHGLAKDPRLPDLGLAGHHLREDVSAQEMSGGQVTSHPHWDREEIHDIFRRWRRIADSYAHTPQGPRVYVAEAWRIRDNGLARYLRPDELHTAFNFDFLKCPWEPEALRNVISRQIAMLSAVGTEPTWVLSSHDLTRPVTRYGLQTDWLARRPGQDAVTADTGLGTRRARAAALLTLALPGSAYIYQGEELGLPEVSDLPEDLLQDPFWRRSGHQVRGRDGCRVPLPWTENLSGLGFSNGSPWLPQPPAWTQLAVSRQSPDPHSTLNLYRQAISIRRRFLTSADRRLEWHDTPTGVLEFDRGRQLTCSVNFTRHAIPLSPGGVPILSSSPLEHELIPADTAVWLHRDGPR